MATALTIALTVLGIVGPIASVLGALGIFKIIAAKVDQEADQLVAKNPNPLSEAEAAALHDAAAVIRSGAVVEGIAKLDAALKAVPKP